MEDKKDQIGRITENFDKPLISTNLYTFCKPEVRHGDFSESEIELFKKDMTINHLEAIRTSLREEILLRIKQRDEFSNYLAIALGTIVTISFSTSHDIFLLTAPFASIYFTSMIIHSYEVHVLIMNYLRDIIEPKLAELCEIPPENEWEKFYTSRKRSGIRRQFFIIAMWLVCLVVPFWLLMSGSSNQKIIILSLVLIIILCVWITNRNGEIDKQSNILTKI